MNNFPKLLMLYKNLLSQDFIRFSELKSVYTERSRIYESGPKISQEQIIEENNLFLDISKVVLINDIHTISAFSDILSLLDKDPALAILENQDKKTILEKKEALFSGILKELKKHPSKAGAKINILKKYIKNIKTSLEKLDSPQSKQPD